MRKFRLRSKCGRPFWRFGVQLSPDEWTEMELTEEQVSEVKDACTLTVAGGGTLMIEPNPWQKAEQPPADTGEKKPGKK